MNRVRYIHDTDGNYVAFVADGALFTPGCEWLGVVDPAGEVFDTDGAFIGALQDDDRLVRHTASQLPRRILPPKPPMPPVRPIAPKRRLFRPALQPPFEDVLHGLRRPLSLLTPIPRLHELDRLQGCDIAAANGAFLGRISRDRTDPRSIADPAGRHGSTTAETSIFNDAGPFGSVHSDLSPYSPSADPPRIVRGNEPVAVLTVQREVQARVDPNELVAWLKLG